MAPQSGDNPAWQDQYPSGWPAMPMDEPAPSWQVVCSEVFDADLKRRELLRSGMWIGLNRTTKLLGDNRRRQI